MRMTCANRAILSVLVANMFMVAQTLGIPFQVIQTNLSEDDLELYFVIIILSVFL